MIIENSAEYKTEYCILNKEKFNNWIESNSQVTDSNTYEIMDCNVKLAKYRNNMNNLQGLENIEELMSATKGVKKIGELHELATTHSSKVEKLIIYILQ